MINVNRARTFDTWANVMGEGGGGGGVGGDGNERGKSIRYF